MKSELRLNLHNSQLQVFHSTAKMNILVAGRGWGKSRYILTKALHRCLSYQGYIDPASPKKVAIGMPYLNQARQVHWGAIVDVLEEMPFVKRVDKSEFLIEFKGRRPDLLIKGADKQAEKWRGLNLLDTYLDEYQDFAPEAWDKVIYPALARNKDWTATKVGTPKGYQNILGKDALKCETLRNWRLFHFHTKDNPFFPRQSLRDAKLSLPPKVYDQEFRASFVNFDGQWFPSYSKENCKKVFNNLSSYRNTYLSVDFGDRNPAIAVTGITHDAVYHALDYWEPKDGEIITEKHLIREALRLAKKYNIWRCYLPDDRPASIKAFRIAGKEQDVQGLQRSIQVNRQEPGISESMFIIDTLFYSHRFYIDESISEIGDDFANYHKAKTSDGLILNKPAPGQRSHVIDAFRYCIATLEHKHRPVADIQTEAEATIKDMFLGNRTRVYS